MRFLLRAHRIGQIRDVHIYRFISQHTVEEALLRKANQKRSLDDIVIQKGEFDWRTLFTEGGMTEGALTRALGEFEDAEDAQAARVAAQEEMELEGSKNMMPNPNFVVTAPAQPQMRTTYDAAPYDNSTNGWASAKSPYAFNQPGTAQAGGR